jgi:hypothetical protein
METMPFHSPFGSSEVENRITSVSTSLDTNGEK